MCLKFILEMLYNYFFIALGAFFFKFLIWCLGCFLLVFPFKGTFQVEKVSGKVTNILLL